MICNVSPAAANVNETLSALRFAKRAKKVRNRAKRNVHSNNEQVALLTAQNLNLQEQIKRLQAEKQDQINQNLKKAVSQSTIVKREDTAETLQKVSNLQKQLKDEKRASAQLVKSNKKLEDSLNVANDKLEENDVNKTKLENEINNLQSNITRLEQEYAMQKDKLTQKCKKSWPCSRLFWGVSTMPLVWAILLSGENRII